MDKVLLARKATLESSFFAEHNAALRDRLKEESETRAQRAAMADALNIPVSSEALLDHLIDLGVTPGGAMALSLVPLVTVAWVDFEMQSAERKAILDAAAERGIAADSVAGQLLQSWLETRPEPSLFEAWKGFAEEVARNLTDDERAGLRESVVAGAREVAEAAGGLLGLAWTVSPEEKALLADIENTLS